MASAEKPKRVRISRVPSVSLPSVFSTASGHTLQALDDGRPLRPFSSLEAVIDAFAHMPPNGPCDKHADPWPLSPDRIILDAVVAKKRRVSSKLVFLSLLDVGTLYQPNGTMNTPAFSETDHDAETDGGGEGAGESGAAPSPENEDSPGFLIQVVIGKHFKERHGLDALVTLLKQIKLGHAVTVVGHPQRNRGRLTPRILDLVCVDILVHGRELPPATAAPQGAALEPGTETRKQRRLRLEEELYANIRDDSDGSSQSEHDGSDNESDNEDDKESDER